MIPPITWIVIILAIIAIARLLRIYEFASEIQPDVKQWEVTEEDNRMNANLMLLFFIAFFIFCFWIIIAFKDNMLPLAASKHGKEVDWLFDFNMLIIGIVAIVTNFFLFYFAYKYSHSRSNPTATYFPESSKLELTWTFIPATALLLLLFIGLRTWNSVTADASKNAIVVELYAKQFDWTARFAGKDNKLGRRDFRLITDTNPMGLDLNDPAGKDDIVVRNEFHIPKGKEISFLMASRDVIHSAYMPHFRAQMNCVPGMTTLFHYIPTITTEEMRKNPQVVANMKEVNDLLAAKGESSPAEFNYLLLCNKICGSGHFNMQMNIIVDEPAQYEEWINKQKTVGSTITAQEPQVENSLTAQK